MTTSASTIQPACFRMIESRVKHLRKVCPSPPIPHSPCHHRKFQQLLHNQNSFRQQSPCWEPPYQQSIHHNSAFQPLKPRMSFSLSNWKTATRLQHGCAKFHRHGATGGQNLQSLVVEGPETFCCLLLLQPRRDIECFSNWPGCTGRYIWLRRRAYLMPDPGGDYISNRTTLQPKNILLSN